ncbi:MAG TPA: hypothetical protein VK673_10610 [Chthoniobacterales bacterium]|nr:hypothetical protein [Chthoniobacterales bacterium]
MSVDRRFLIKAEKKIMKTITTSNWGPPRRALCVLLLCIATFWAMSSNARAQLYVADNFFGTVGKYDATTGAPVNANFITGLNEPERLALSGNDLFVANAATGTVGEYDASTGAAINANFITGLNRPFALALSGSNLFVSEAPIPVSGTVGKYDATTGAAINAAFIPTGGALVGPTGLAVVQTVPEPSPWSMIAVGGVVLLGIMLRKKHGIA